MIFYHVPIHRFVLRHTLNILTLMFSNTRKLPVLFELFQTLVMCNECLIRFVYPFIHKFVLKLTFVETFILNFVSKRCDRY